MKCILSPGIPCIPPNGTMYGESMANGPAGWLIRSSGRYGWKPLRVSNSGCTLGDGGCPALRRSILSGNTGVGEQPRFFIRPPLPPTFPMCAVDCASPYGFELRR